MLVLLSLLLCIGSLGLSRLGLSVRVVPSGVGLNKIISENKNTYLMVAGLFDWVLSDLGWEHRVEALLLVLESITNIDRHPLSAGEEGVGAGPLQGLHNNCAEILLVVRVLGSAEDILLSAVLDDPSWEATLHL